MAEISHSIPLYSLTRFGRSREASLCTLAPRELAVSQDTNPTREHILCIFPHKTNTKPLVPQIECLGWAAECFRWTAIDSPLREFRSWRATECSEVRHAPNPFRGPHREEHRKRLASVECWVGMKGGASTVQSHTHHLNRTTCAKRLPALNACRMRLSAFPPLFPLFLLRNLCLMIWLFVWSRAASISHQKTRRRRRKARHLLDAHH